MAKLIGTDPNQVPTNGDLGDLAYQNKDSVKVEAFESNGIDDNATSTAMTLDSSGNVLVGTTETDVGYTDSGAGISLRGGVGNIGIARSNSTVLDLNRLDGEGNLVVCYKDGASRGIIGLEGYDSFYIGNTNSANGGGIHFHNNGPVSPMKNGVRTNNHCDLGTSGFQWKDLYLSGGVVFGSTGGSVTSKTLDDYEEGTWTPTFTSSGSSCDATVTIIEGKYTKVGRLVTCYIRWQLSNNGTATGTAGISLPFAVADVMTSTAVQGQASVGWTSSSGTTLLFAAPWEGNTDVRFGKASSHNDTATYALRVDEVGNGFDGRMTVTYMTT